MVILTLNYYYFDYGNIDFKYYFDYVNNDFKLIF